MAEVNITLDGKLTREGLQTIDEINEVWISITKQLFERERFIYKVDIDGSEFYDSYETVILNNASTINQVAIHTVEHIEAFNNSIYEMKQYAARMLQHLDAVASPFYGNMRQEDWELFNQFTQGIGWLNQSAQFCLEIAGRQAGKVDESLVVLLSGLKEGTEQTLKLYLDWVSQQQYNQLADALLYEFPSLIEPLQELKLAGE